MRIILWIDANNLSELAFFSWTRTHITLLIQSSISHPHWFFFMGLVYNRIERILNVFVFYLIYFHNPQSLPTVSNVWKRNIGIDIMPMQWHKKLNSMNKKGNAFIVDGLKWEIIAAESWANKTKNTVSMQPGLDKMSLVIKRKITRKKTLIDWRRREFHVCVCVCVPFPYQTSLQLNTFFLSNRIFFVFPLPGCGQQ